MQHRTTDGFVSYRNGHIEKGLEFSCRPVKCKVDEQKLYDAIVIGAGFAGLICARELSLRGWSVLIIEARDRIGGRTLTTKIDHHLYEIGGTWIHWTQPHIWSEMTRYGLSLVDFEATEPETITLLLDGGTSSQSFSAREIFPKLFEMMNRFSDIDGALGRTIFPWPHSPLAMRDYVEKFDHLSVKDRFDQMRECWKDDEYLEQFMNAYISMNTQGDPAKCGYLDHLCFWALGDYETGRTWEKTSRYKIRQGTSALADAILNDCQNIDLLLSTPVTLIERKENGTVLIVTENQEKFASRTAIITVPLNALNQIEFLPALSDGKCQAIADGQCRGGTKFYAQLQEPIGSWCGFAAYPNPITVAYTDDAEGTMIVGFGPDDALDIENSQMVEEELKKFLPQCKVQYTFGHKWRDDRFVHSTWSWYRPGQISNHLLNLQTPEPPLFFASADASNSWRGCIDGAIESALTTVRHCLQRYDTKKNNCSLVAVNFSQ